MRRITPSANADPEIQRLASDLNQILSGIYASLNNPKIYAVADLPTANVTDTLVRVSDETGGFVLAFWDGTDWRRVTDRAVVS